jgi:chromosome segregation ATPase
MAPRGSKRVAAVAVAPQSPKKPKVDSKFTGIIATIHNADSLNEHCREMLVAMVSSLSTPKSERHPSQQLGVEMIEETLQDARKKFAGSAAQAEEERTELEGSKETRAERVRVAEASLNEKQADENAAQTASNGAQEAVKSAEGALAEAKEAQIQGEKPIIALGEEKAALSTAFQEHFVAPMESNQGPHYNFLEPFTEKIGLEESLIKALPSSCVKTKEQRGGFDELVIAEFEKSMRAKIASLEKALADDIPAASARKESVVSAEAALESKVASEKTAAAELVAATSGRVEAEEELSKAKEDCAALEPTLAQVTQKHLSLQSELKDFETGTLASFESFRDQECPQPIEEEAASAGA